MSNEPLRIANEKVVDLLVGLGLDPDMKTLRSVHVEPQKITVVRYRTNERGNMLVAGDEALTETVTIRIDFPVRDAAPCGQVPCEHAPDGGNHPGAAAEVAE